MKDKPLKILGIDPGKKRVGLAIGNCRFRIATGYKTIKYGSKEKFINTLQSIVEEEEIDLVVIGLPKNMNGTEGESANFSKRLADLIKRNLNLKVEFVDERLTTEEAIRQIHQAEKKVGKSKETIDMLSAAIILQSYLDKN
jgi:putative Holliday junction resolvase